MRDVKPSTTGESQKVKVKVRVNIHGTFKVAQASLVEVATAENSSTEPMEVEANQSQDASDTQSSPQKTENGPKSDDVSVALN